MITLAPPIHKQLFEKEPNCQHFPTSKLEIFIFRHVSAHQVTNFHTKERLGVQMRFLTIEVQFIAPYLTTEYVLYKIKFLHHIAITYILWILFAVPSQCSEQTNLRVMSFE